MRSWVVSAVALGVGLIAARGHGQSAPAPPPKLEPELPEIALRDLPHEPAKKPPPLYVEYASYGVAFTADVLAHPGRSCPSDIPCILGGGGGLALRGGFRWPNRWYLGGAYQVSRTDSSNLYRLATLQQLRLELRYMLDMGYRTVPYVTWGAGGVAYGNELGVETGGGSIFAGFGAEVQLSRLAVLGVGARYQPMLLAGFTDSAGFERPWGAAHYVTLELQLEIRSEVSGR
jgi:hypothetical protein